MEKIILAGACSIFGLEDLSLAFNNLGYEPNFIEATFMKSYLQKNGVRYKNINFIDEIKNFPLIPLSEYWISHCIKEKNCKISQNALIASRNKLFFNQLLKNFNLPNCTIYPNKPEALNAIKNGEAILIKPAGANSGYGTAIVNRQNIFQFERLFTEAAEIKNKILALMQVEKSEVLLCKYINGTEFSADCFLCNGKAKIIRLCQKNVLKINNKPCTACVQLVKPSEKIKNAIENWLNILFSPSDLSFAQFDFIQTENEEIIPIDFACRIGGGMAELLGECEKNPYAEAIFAISNIETPAKAGNFSNILGILNNSNIEKSEKIKKPIVLLDKLEIFKSEELCKPNKNWKIKNDELLTMLNYLPIKSGYVTSENFVPQNGKITIFKKKGSFVTSNPSSVASKMATQICPHSLNFSTEELTNLLIAEPFIQKEKIK